MKIQLSLSGPNIEFTRTADVAHARPTAWAARRLVLPKPVKLMLLAGALAAAAPALGAALPEPDNVLYGKIYLGTNLVTAATTNVWVEVQRPEGILITSYQMGNEPRLGNFYSLSIPVASMLDLAQEVLGDDPLASQVNAVLALSVKECPNPRYPATFYTRYQTNIVVEGRGQVRRLDFGSAQPVSDYDSWAGANGLAAGSGNHDADGDGHTNMGEYVAGTDPNNSESKLLLSISQTATNPCVSFFALKAQGTGYTGRTRFYDLEQTPELAGVWAAVPGYTNIAGAGQTVSCSLSNTNDAVLYRVRVWLNP